MIGLIMYIDTHKSYTHWGAGRLQELEFFTKLNFQYFVKLPACNPIHIQILVSIKSHKVTQSKSYQLNLGSTMQRYSLWLWRWRAPVTLVSSQVAILTFLQVRHSDKLLYFTPGADHQRHLRFDGALRWKKREKSNHLKIQLLQKSRGEAQIIGFCDMLPHLIIPA